MAQNLFAPLDLKYHMSQPAEALFFRSPLHANVKALRIVVENINKEFTDNAFIGKDPSGRFFYNDVGDLANATKYRVKRKTDPPKVADIDEDPANADIYASVEFYDTGNKVLAEFLAKDPYETVSGAVMDGHSNSGTWRDTTTNTAVAYIKKDPDSNTITLDASTSIEKVAQLKMNAGSTIPATLKAATLNVSGTLHYRKRNTLKTSKYANYNNDRIVFYDDDFTGTNFTGFFIPGGRALGAANALGVGNGDDVVFNGNTWADT